MILIWIEGVLLLSYLILNGIYGYYFTYSYNLENNAIINEIDESLNGKLIYFFRNSTLCKPNEEELIIDRFDTTPEFCSCYDTFMGYGKCADAQDYCDTINSIPSSDYTMINFQHICVIKSDKSYIDFLRNNEIIPGNEKCPSSYKSCGIIDTLGRQLCVKNTNYCPIKKSDIEYDKNNSSQILYFFKIRPNYPCINPSEKNWVYNGDLSPLTKYCTKEDKRYERIDKFNTTLYDLYKGNNILEKLPSYDEKQLKNETVYLYARNYLGINTEKAFQFSKEKLLNAQKLVNNCCLAMKIVTFIILIPVCCLGGGGAAGGGEIALGLLAIYTIPASITYFILSIIIFVNNNTITSMLDIGGDAYINSEIKALLAGNSVNFGLPLASIIIFPLIIILGVICLFLKDRYYY